MRKVPTRIHLCMMQNYQKPQVWRRCFTSPKPLIGPPQPQVKLITMVKLLGKLLQKSGWFSNCCPRDADTVLRMFWSQVKEEGRVPMNKLLVEMLEANTQWSSHYQTQKKGSEEGDLEGTSWVITWWAPAWWSPVSSTSSAFQPWSILASTNVDPPSSTKVGGFKSQSEQIQILVSIKIQMLGSLFNPCLSILIW